MTLRPYQVVAIERARELVSAGKRRLIVVAPTGSGKTVILSEIVRGYRDRSRGQVVIVAHRRELIDQTVDKLARAGVSCGVMMSSDPRRDPLSPVQVCSIQTLARREAPPAGLVIIDEVHHASSDSYTEVLGHYQDAIQIGFTATPWRLDGRGLIELFPDHLVAATPSELIQSGHLVHPECFAYDSPDLRDVKTTAGEYNQSQLSVACNTSVIAGEIIGEYQKHASGKQALVFPVDCRHSRDLVSGFVAAGVSAAHLDFKTPRSDRTLIIDDFRAGRLLVLSSVGVLTEGFDAPSAEVCIIARPTKSVSLSLQMMGRVLRPSAGKNSALIHDHAGNLFRHGFPDDDRDWTPGSQRAKPSVCMSCTDCGFMVRSWPANGLCPKCGSLQAQVSSEARDASEVKRGRDRKRIVDGTRLTREEIQEIRDQLGGRDLTPAQAQSVADATREQKAAEYLRLKAVADRKGFKPGFVAHQFRSQFGKWPKFTQAELEFARPALYPFLPYSKK